MAQTAPHRKAVGYLRDRECNGRRAVLEDFCRHRGLELAQVIDTEQGIDAAVNEACAVKGVLVSDRLDTLASSMLDCVRLCRRLHENGVDLALLAEGVDTTDHESPQRDLIFRLMASIAQLEYHRLADRLPYGYTVADDIEHIRVNKKEAAVIQRIIGWRRDGQSEQQIADRLNRDAVAGRGGEAWNAAAVKKVIDHAPTSRWLFDDEDGR